MQAFSTTPNVTLMICYPASDTLLPRTNQFAAHEKPTEQALTYLF